MGTTQPLHGPAGIERGNPPLRRNAGRPGDGRPVLQFNRIDFRLAWFAGSFPAKIVHIYRHPQINGARRCWTSRVLDRTRGESVSFSRPTSSTWGVRERPAIPFPLPRKIGHPSPLLLPVEAFVPVWDEIPRRGVCFEDLVTRPGETAGEFRVARHPTSHDGNAGNDRENAQTRQVARLRGRKLVPRT